MSKLVARLVVVHMSLLHSLQCRQDISREPNAFNGQVLMYHPVPPERRSHPRSIICTKLDFGLECLLLLDWPKFLASLAYSITRFIALIFMARVLRDADGIPRTRRFRVRPIPYHSAVWHIFRFHE